MTVARAFFSRCCLMKFTDWALRWRVCTWPPRVFLRMLGTSMPVSNLVDAAVRHKADVIGLSVTEFMTWIAFASPWLLVGELPDELPFGWRRRSCTHLWHYVELAPDWEALDSLVDAWRKKHRSLGALITTVWASHPRRRTRRCLSD